MQSTLASPGVDLKRLLTIIRQSGYHGYLPIETLRMGRKDYDSFVETLKLQAALQAAIAATA
jgi:hypothetical protein